MQKTKWSIKPITGFSFGDVLLPMREFPASNRMVRVRREGEYDPCGVIEGDGAIALMERFTDPLPKMRVVYVSQVSGYATAQLQETPGAGPVNTVGSMHNTGSYTLIVKKAGMSPRVKRPAKDCPFAALEMHDDLVQLNPDSEIVIACLMNGKIEAECAGTIRAIRDAPA